MTNILYTIGKWCASHKWRVLITWILLVVLLLGGALLLKPSFSDDMSIPGTSSEKASAIIEKAFPTDDTHASARIVVQTPKGTTISDSSVQDDLAQTISTLEKDSLVETVSSPVDQQTVNESGTIMYLTITYKQTAKKLSEKALATVEKTAEKLEDQGYTVGYSGDILPFELEIGGISEIIGIMLALVVLFFMFGQIIIAGLPIITALMGLLVSIAMTFMMTKILTISSFSLSLMVMIGLAVGIDYALFIYSKHQKQLQAGMPLLESISLAVATAGGAVVFAGLTVIVALSGLLVVGIPFLGIMGVAAAISVLLAVLTSITLTPAILAFVGERIGHQRRGTKQVVHEKQPKKPLAALIYMVTKRPLLTVVLSLLLLVSVSLPAASMQLGLPDAGMEKEDAPDRIAYDLMADGFGDGVNAPLAILLDAGTDADNETFDSYAKEISKLTGVTYSSPVYPDQSGRYAIINVQPATGANDEATADLVHKIRQLTVKNEQAKIYVTGITAINLDISEKLKDAIPIFAALIMGFAFLLLLLVFRSILLPLLAVGGFLLTLVATLGVSVFFIQEGHLKTLTGIPEAGPLLAFLPILVIGILFGLAMDYQVFLATRMREEYIETQDSKQAIIMGLKDSGPVVIAAGMIMTFVFAGFIFAGDSMIKSMGITLTFGVIFDAFIVRMILIPALMRLFGQSIWYLPKFLQRLLPDIDIEGQRFKAKN